MRKVVLLCSLFVLIATGVICAVAINAKPDPVEAVADKKQAEEARHYQAGVELAENDALALRQAVLNPESLRVTSAFVPDDLSAVCFKYRSQNALGGMAREEAVMSSAGYVASSNKRFHAEWKKHCSMTGYEDADKVALHLQAYEQVHPY